jgi:ketosteroid isomerase-like protein
MESWRSILTGPSPPEIACTREAAYVFGDMAFVICMETVEDGPLMATNVFIREMGRWKIVHHHAGPIAHPTDEEDDESSSGLLN